MTQRRRVPWRRLWPRTLLSRALLIVFIPLAILQAVTAYGNEEPLKPGMLLDADILGEKRRLIEWVFEPLYSLKGRVGDG